MRLNGSKRPAAETVRVAAPCRSEKAAQIIILVRVLASVTNFSVYKRLKILILLIGSFCRFGCPGWGPQREVLCSEEHDRRRAAAADR